MPCGKPALVGLWWVKGATFRFGKFDEKQPIRQAVPAYDREQLFVARTDTKSCGRCLRYSHTSMRLVIKYTQVFFFSLFPLKMSSYRIGANLTRHHEQPGLGFPLLEEASFFPLP